MRMEHNELDVVQYLDSLINRAFKILPLYEESNEGLFVYIQSLIYEVYGIRYVIKELGASSDYVMLLAILESLSDDAIMIDDRKKEIVKREVFKCIDLIKKIKSADYNGGESYD